jgi:hypothetical protein
MINPTDYIANLGSNRYEGKDPNLDQYVAWLKIYLIRMHNKNDLAKEALEQAEYYLKHYEVNNSAGDPSPF